MTDQRTIDLSPQLSKCRDLLVDHKVAQRLHIPTDALIELVKKRLGPEPHPASASGCYWFLKLHVPSWKSWARNAGDEDVRQAADIILKDDRTRRVREFAHYDNADPRTFLTTLFSRKAW
ncbi:hypothetical protein [Mesorhizobium kowhaii]|uniref:Uncharacterized protein n=1 Tax=Mesorhizobium kowhaii TaxID=1300272 RepID=A0A2W7BTS4_9HYPH|nr:hypothetical protein [Mesorhizobium kowhaii]PZV34014.1 hypothetical protein B5V02_33450 [Mesorhizobium kowhaii]